MRAQWPSGVVGHPIHSHDVVEVADGQDLCPHDFEMGRVGGVVGQVFLGPVAAVEEVGEV